MRPSLSLQAAQWAWWLGSVVFSLALWEGLFYLSWLLRARTYWQKVLVYGTSLTASALAVLSVGFHQVFFCWPTAYAGMHVLRHRREGLGYFIDGVRPIHAVELVAIAAFIIICWRFGLNQQKRYHRRLQYLFLLALLIGGGISFGTVHRYASAMVPDAAGVKLSIDLVMNSVIGGVHGRLMQAHRPPPTEIYTGPGLGDAAPNLILIIGESVSVGHTGLYNYHFQTTPRLAALKKKRQQDWTQFTRAIANASATKVSLPTMLTGLFPSRQPIELHTFPLLWHYAHAAGYQTALVSSQSYTWNNLEGFFIDEVLDHAFTLERSNAKIVNSEGMDDSVMLSEALRTVDFFTPNKPFFLALQFNCTHYPGYSPAVLRLWPEADDNKTARYDNSIVYMDHLLGNLFEHLEEQGLTDNTIIVFASDHGEDIDGVHQLHRTDSYYQSTIHIPFFFIIPEKHRQRLGPAYAQMQRNAKLRVALSDLVPTALDIMGLTTDPKVGGWLAKLDGLSLLRPLPPNRFLVAVNTDEHVKWSRKGYAVIADDWKYIYYSWIGPMLFNLSTDRLEQHNLLDGIGGELSPEAKRYLHRVRDLVAQTPSLASMSGVKAVE
jgi:glucan phosphoethanolaminetransferase (alkaline phosphatase superfamily)